jgi:hypothetical protein
MKTAATILIFGALSTAALAGEVDIDSTYFHPAASLYIHGDAANASNLVAQGLSHFPEDGKLLRLQELLDQQQDQQQDEDQQQNQQQKQDQEQDQNQQQDQNQEQEQQDAQPPEPQQAEQMNQDEAERLLDAMKQEEENKRLQLRPVRGRPVRVDKDW